MPDITDNFSHEPYPREWDQSVRDLWDTEPNTYRELYSASEWRDLQTSFHNGWIAGDMSKDDHDYWRDQFYAISGTTPDGFDWAAWRAYLGY